MGCWNGTCGLTQLPIKCGEKVVLVPLVNKGVSDLAGGGFCYADDICKPLTPAIVGEYNDYGSLENVEENQVIIDFFMKNYNTDIEEAIEEESRYDKIQHPLTLENIIRFIERGHLSKVTFMMFHEEVYRKVIEEFGSRKPYDKDFTFREHIEKIARKHVEERKKILQDPDCIEAHFIDFDRDDFGRVFGRNMRYFLKQLPAQANDDLLNNMIDLYIMMCVFNYSRRAWMPQCGAGSQSEEYMLPKVIAEFIVEKEAKVRQERLEDEVLDDEEDKQYIEDITRETIHVYIRDED